jgi:hypothetical protein
MTDVIDILINKFSPYIFFHIQESCFPILLPVFLSQMEIKSKIPINDTFQNPTNEYCYELFNKKDKDWYNQLFLSPKINDWKNNTKGDPLQTNCYCKAIKINDNKYILVYIYFFSHTEPYKLFNKFMELDCYAHVGDFKSIAVEIEYKRPTLVNENIEEKDVWVVDIKSNKYKDIDLDLQLKKVEQKEIENEHKNLSQSIEFKQIELDRWQITRVHLDAHGSKGGEWRDIKEMEIDETHPIVYSCKGDHSFYHAAGIYPRIFGLIYDICSKDVLTKPVPTRVYDELDKNNFNVETTGCLYFPGDMGPNGIDAAYKHDFWIADFPETSNNWYRRLFFPEYF